MKPIIGSDLSKVSRIIYIPTKNKQPTHLRPQFIIIFTLYQCHYQAYPTFLLIQCRVKNTVLQIQYNKLYKREGNVDTRCSSTIFQLYQFFGPIWLHFKHINCTTELVLRFKTGNLFSYNK